VSIGAAALGTLQPLLSALRVASMELSGQWRDEEVLDHSEMEEADLVGRSVEAENKIRKDAKQASLTRIELLVVVGGDEQFARRRENRVTNAGSGMPTRRPN
jgi:hypothetical protein